MRRLLLTAVLAPIATLGVTLTVAAAPGHAAGPATCDVPRGPLVKDLDAAATVVRGTVTEVGPPAGGEVAYTVQVKRIYKGTAPATTTIYGPDPDSNCPLPDVKVGQEWLFLMPAEDGVRLVTSSSDGTRRAREAVVDTVVAELGRGTRPEAEPVTPPAPTFERVSDSAPREFWPLAMPGAILAGVSLVVVAAARALGRTRGRSA